MTDKILIDRSVVEQALSTLTGWGNYDKWVWHESALSTAKKNTAEMITALRAALEQPQDHFPNAENRVPTGWKLVPVEPTKDMKAAGAFAAMDQVRRSYNPPSAYIPVDSMALLSYRAMIATAPQRPVVKESLTVGQPQPQQPLTDEQVMQAVRHLYQSDVAAEMGFPDDLYVARAIEAAHGIGE